MALPLAVDVDALALAVARVDDDRNRETALKNSRSAAALACLNLLVLLGAFTKQASRFVGLDSDNHLVLDSEPAWQELMYSARISRYAPSQVAIVAPSTRSAVARSS